ncbi:MAG: hypothetical protein KatS3mg031_0789 [Chitinophagales bacterium]|nr:MAG: hypothetical protein KatS3mg031_0789 [Chitinophagales bacterium]
MKQYTLCAVLSLTCSAMLYAQIPDPRMVPFIHGVASGDALSDKVIIWTRISRSDSSSFTVRWQIATDTSMTQIVNQGTATTDASVDYTVKVDVGGLQPDTWYYYQFAHDGRKSLIGRTKTLPAGNNFRIRVAVASCARYGNGDYYNAYRHIAERNDIQAVIFLGDYIYEGGGGISGREAANAYHSFGWCNCFAGLWYVCDCYLAHYAGLFKPAIIRISGMDFMPFKFTRTGWS